MPHAAILPTQNHANIVAHVLPGNPQLAATAVMIQDVSFDDASKISTFVAQHGLAPLDWQPPITQPAQPKPPAPVEPVPPSVPKPIPEPPVEPSAEPTTEPPPSSTTE